MTEEESGAPNDSKPADRGRFWAFWTTLPGILTGGAAAITAIISLLAVFHPSEHASTGTTAPTVTSRLGPATVSTPPTAAAGPTSGVLAQGQLSQKVGDWADLEGGRTGNGVPSADLALLGGVYELTSLGGPLAPAGDGTIDKSACAAALNAHNDTYEILSQFHVGSQLCVDTHDNHVAVLRVVSLPGVGNSQFVYAYTVWQ
jgi:hypothetical protein